MPKAYYNEFDPYAAQWLRNLIAAGHIAPGDVDERDIRAVRPEDLKGYTQVHFFAGIGGWSYALRLAGWPDDGPVWTGSCPCQPFSAAGKRKGKKDDRHLWPEFFRLIRECRPATVFGEQVASKDGLAWLDDVQADLESTDYAVGALDLCAPGLGAFHIRQRLYFVAHTQSWRRDGALQSRKRQGFSQLIQPSATEHMAHAARGGAPASEQRGQLSGALEESATDELGNTDHTESARLGQHGGQVLPIKESEGLGLSGDAFGIWANPHWLYCRDDKWRPTESRPEPLADGLSHRLGYVRAGEGQEILSPLQEKAFSRVRRLRGYGNAIVPQVAAAFVRAAMEYVR